MDDVDFLLSLIDNDEEKKIIKVLSSLDCTDEKFYEKALADLLGVENDNRI